MKTSVHLVVSLILAVLLYPLFNWKVLLIIVGGVLIDIDHYFWYVCKYKKFSLLDCYYHYIIPLEKNDKSKNIGILMIFHTVEFLFIMVFLSFFIEYALVFTIGLLVHYLLDLIFLYGFAKRFIADHSIIHWIFKHKLESL